jgi:hypothetical protein
LTALNWSALTISGNEKFAFDCIELGLLINYTGIRRFKNAGTLGEAATKVSLNH